MLPDSSREGLSRERFHGWLRLRCFPLVCVGVHGYPVQIHTWIPTQTRQRRKSKENGKEQWLLRYRQAPSARKGVRNISRGCTQRTYMSTIGRLVGTADRGNGEG